METETTWLKAQIKQYLIRYKTKGFIAALGVVHRLSQWVSPESLLKIRIYEAVGEKMHNASYLKNMFGTENK